MTSPKFRTEFDPKYNESVELVPGLSRIVVNNPSPFTFHGTNTYLLGDERVAIIDPGPEDNVHLDDIIKAIGGRPVSHIIVTHSHLDHSPLARPLAQASGAPVLAFGSAEAGRSPIMQDLARSGLMGGGEGIDSAFSPDITLADGEQVTGDGWTLEALHTPGHIGNHLSLAWNDACFTADHVMGWASSLVSPPDGDLTDFMASCARLAARDWRVFYPGHGAAIDDPAARLNWLIAHRRTREASILAELANGPATAATLAARIYADTPPALLGAATRNVLAHLIDLMGKSITTPVGGLHAEAAFTTHLDPPEKK